MFSFALGKEKGWGYGAVEGPIFSIFSILKTPQDGQQNIENFEIFENFDLIAIYG